MLGDWVGSPVGVPDEQAIPSTDGLFDVENLRQTAASLLSGTVHYSVKAWDHCYRMGLLMVKEEG
jgi:hypothetical protein